MKALIAVSVALFYISPAVADNSPKKQKPAPAKAEKKKDCLDTEIKRVETALQNIGRAIGNEFDQLDRKLTESEIAREKAESESKEAHKRRANAEAVAANLKAEFNAYKASSEKQRAALIARLEKAEESSKGESKIIADLKRKNAQLEKECAAVCARLKAIADQLEGVEKKLPGTKKKKP